VNVVWQIVQGEKGEFEILKNGETVKSAVPDRWLEDELARYGFCGEEYRGIRDQLAKSGKAVVDLGQVEQQSGRRTRNHGGR
jgi:hypothetical protein